MSAHAATRTGSTRTLPARAPDGFPFAHPRYRWYVLFAATGLPLAVSCVLLLLAVRAISQGSQAWAQYLALMASPPMLALSIATFVAVLYFAIRFLWVGRKIPGVRLGPVPAMSFEVAAFAHFVGFVKLFVLVVVLLSGWLFL
jgi:fumarate reductase subunit C